MFISLIPSVRASNYRVMSCESIQFWISGILDIFLILILLGEWKKKLCSPLCHIKQTAFVIGQKKKSLFSFLGNKSILKKYGKFPCFIVYFIYLLPCTATIFFPFRKELTGHVFVVPSLVTREYLQWWDISLPTRDFGTSKDEGSGFDSFANM